MGCLKGDAFWSNVPEPAARRAVRDGKLMVELLMETDDESSEIVAVRIRATQSDLEDAMLAEMLVDIANMVSWYCVFSSRSGDMRHREWLQS